MVLTSAWAGCNAGWGKRERLGGWLFTAYLNWVTYGVVNFWRDVHKPLVLRTHYFYLPYIWVPSIHAKQNIVLFKYTYIIFATTARIKKPMMARVVCIRKGAGHISLHWRKSHGFFTAKQPVFLCRPRTRERSNESSGTGRIIRPVLEHARMKTEKMVRNAKNPCLHAKISRRRITLKKPILWNKPTAILSSAFCIFFELGTSVGNIKLQYN